MYALSLLALFLATTQAEATPTADEVRTVRWSVRGISHALEVQTEGNDLKLLQRPHAYLRSIVGPIVSTLHRHDWVADNGGYRTQKIVTETQGAYPFDLLTWLDQSGQSGVALRQLIEGPTCDFDGNCGPTLAHWPARPQCPTADSLSAYDGGFVEMARLLVEAQCFSEEQVRIQPESFWIDGWNGREVTLAVQRDHCEAKRSTCTGAFAYVKVKPPKMWTGWLENAAAGQGYLPLMATPGAAPAAPPAKQTQTPTPAPTPATAPKAAPEGELPGPPQTL